jgi:ribonuclease HI
MHHNLRIRVHPYLPITPQSSPGGRPYWNQSHHDDQPNATTQPPPPLHHGHGPTDFRRIWGRSRWPDAAQTIRFKKSLRKRKAIMASDGSLLEGRGSTGWILAIRTGQLSFEEIATGGAPVDCNPEENSSTRCELSGILASLAAIERVTNGRATGLITAGCDSSAALAGVKKWLSQRFATRHMQAGSNSDLIREIRAVYRKLPRLHIKWLKVEAHLDRDPQTLNEVLNV